LRLALAFLKFQLVIMVAHMMKVKKYGRIILSLSFGQCLLKDLMGRRGKSYDGT